MTTTEQTSGRTTRSAKKLWVWCGIVTLAWFDVSVSGQTNTVGYAMDAALLLTAFILAG